MSEWKKNINNFTCRFHSHFSFVALRLLLMFRNSFLYWKYFKLISARNRMPVGWWERIWIQIKVANSTNVISLTATDIATDSRRNTNANRRDKHILRCSTQTTMCVHLLSVCLSVSKSSAFACIFPWKKRIMNISEIWISLMANALHAKCVRQSKMSRRRWEASLFLGRRERWWLSFQSHIKTFIHGYLQFASTGTPNYASPSVTEQDVWRRRQIHIRVQRWMNLGITIAPTTAEASCTAPSENVRVRARPLKL